MKNILLTFLAIILIIVLLWTAIEINRYSDEYRYGNSFRQNKIVNVIRLHKYGITGERVKIGVIDAGFYASHSSFEKTKIIKEYDFVRMKESTFDENHISGVDHGTNVFSVMGGYKENQLIGIAFGAEYILAKTDISTERLVEEEINAVKASNWLYENGCRIITTSLSFNKFDNADYYYPNQMNGKTAKITMTADSLVNKGIIYFCSAGNNYDNYWKIIEPPGDGFNVLSIGSIDKDLQHSFFSSSGPTIDGRIKPDIVAPGEGIWNANYLPKLKPEYGWNHGTSLSAPIAAGIAALILSTHPELTSLEVIEAIKRSSSKSNSPDSLYGYGIPDAEKCVSYFGPAFSNTPSIIKKKKYIEAITHVFSSYGIDESSVELYYYLDDMITPKVIKMKLIDNDYYSGLIEVSENIEEIKFHFKARDSRNKLNKYPSGFLGENFTYVINKGIIQVQQMNLLK